MAIRKSSKNNYKNRKNRRVSKKRVRKGSRAESIKHSKSINNQRSIYRKIMNTISNKKRKLSKRFNKLKRSYRRKSSKKRHRGGSRRLTVKELASNDFIELNNSIREYKKKYIDPRIKELTSDNDNIIDYDKLRNEEKKNQKGQLLDLKERIFRIRDEDALSKTPHQNELRQQVINNYEKWLNSKKQGNIGEQPSVQNQQQSIENPLGQSSVDSSLGQSQVKPITNVEAELPVQPVQIAQEPMAATGPNPNAMAATEPNAMAATGPNAMAATGPNADVMADQPNVMSATGPNTDAMAATEPNANAMAATGPNTDAMAATGPNTDAQPGAVAAAVPEALPDTQSVAMPVGQTREMAGTNTGSQSGTVSGTNTGAQTREMAGTNTGAQSGTVSGTNTGDMSGTNTAAQLGAISGAESGKMAEQNVETIIDPEYGVLTGVENAGSKITSFKNNTGTVRQLGV